MMEDQLIQYGAMGVFVSYLIYDRQVLLKKLTAAINNLSSSIAKKRG